MSPVEVLMKYISTLSIYTPCLLYFATTSLAQGVIDIRLSYKVVLNPQNGQRPTSSGHILADIDIDSAIQAMNALHEAFQRGYRFIRVDEVTNIGSVNDSEG